MGSHEVAGYSEAYSNFQGEMHGLEQGPYALKLSQTID